MIAFSVPRKPNTWRPSSVKVPVLSKTIILTLPATFTRGGEMQKILFFLSLASAKRVPAVIAAGKAGGTVIVIKSNERSTISSVGSFYSIICFKVDMNPMTAIIPITKINLSESS